MMGALADLHSIPPLGEEMVEKNAESFFDGNNQTNLRLCGPQIGSNAEGSRQGEDGKGATGRNLMPLELII